MKKLFGLIGVFLGLFFSIAVSGQVLEPVKWTFDSKQLPNGSYELKFKAKIDDGWYVYSQKIDEGGPIPTSITFEENGDFKQLGKIRERGDMVEKQDPVFDMVLRKYADELTLVSVVKPLKEKGKVSGYLTFMTCDNGRCLPPEDIDFSFDISQKAPQANTPVPGEVKIASPAPKPGQASNTSGILEPVDWKFSKKDLGNGEFLLNFDAKIDKGWYVYSQNVKAGGPQPTTFEFDKNSSFKLMGKVDEKGNLIEGFDKIFEMTVRKYKDKINFSQKVKVNKPNAKVSGYLTFMTCDHERCLPPEDVDFSFNLLNAGNQSADQKIKNRGGTVVPQEEDDVDDPSIISEAVDQQMDVDEMMSNSGSKKGTSNTGTNRADGAAKPGLISGGKSGNQTNNAIAGGAGANAAHSGSTGKKAAGNGLVDISGPNMFESVIADCGVETNKEEKEGRTPWVIFILGFLGGFAALLTPCVFPMIPMTVSYFTKMSKDKKKGLINALIYAVSIIVIYVSLGFFVTMAFGADSLSILSTNPIMNLAFFAIFVIFAISFFGYFEITLPSWMINKSDSASDRGGLIGIFFMAFTLALVSFSCTGPIIGTLLVEAAVGGKTLGPVVGMFGFALALALPFALFAAFPGWLNSLPKSGGWLDTVKKVLGFIELIFALKFLSNADMVPQWGLLPREIFLAIWAVLLFGLGFYLLGFIKLPHDSPVKKKGPIRLGLSGLSIVMGLLLIPGIFLKPIPLIGGLISGFPPPMFYNISNLWGDQDANHADDGGIHGIMNLEDGIAEAKKSGKPILLDFTGWACVNCRKMEENVWPKMEELMKEYTLISLYVDENVKLPKEEQFAYELNGKKKKVRSVGNKWSYLQTKCFNTNSQPFYILLNHEGEHLAPPRGYTPELKDYSDFLEEGVKNFKRGKSLLGSR